MAAPRFTDPLPGLREASRASTTSQSGRPLVTGSPNTTEGDCYLGQLPPNTSTFRASGATCAPSRVVSPGEPYLLNVQSVGTAGAASTATPSRRSRTGPRRHPAVALRLRQHADAEQQLLLRQGRAPPAATFYLAEVAPQYAGKVLVMELWDPGDVDGTATMTPMSPQTA